MSGLMVMAIVMLMVMIVMMVIIFISIFTCTFRSVSRFGASRRSIVTITVKEIAYSTLDNLFSFHHYSFHFLLSFICSVFIIVFNFLSLYSFLLTLYYNFLLFLSSIISYWYIILGLRHYNER